MTDKSIGELLAARIERRGKQYELPQASEDVIKHYDTKGETEPPLFWRIYAYKRIGIAVTVDHDGQVEISTSRARSKSKPVDMDKALRMLGFNPRALPAPVQTENGRMYLALKYEYKE